MLSAILADASAVTEPELNNIALHFSTDNYNDNDIFMLSVKYLTQQHLTHKEGLNEEVQMKSDACIDLISLCGNDLEIYNE